MAKLRLVGMLVLCTLWANAQQAKNVVLFIGDAGGVPTLNAASLLGHGEPLKLYIQSMPYVGLSDTSTVSRWVSDSAAGMTAVVTGVKTHNGVVSQGPDAVSGEKDGTDLKTILEYAEEHGLSTGVVTNMNVTDATPAATYAHVNRRSNFARIFRQFLAPRSGDGVDVLIGPGLFEINEALEVENATVSELMREAGRTLYGSLEAIPPDATRAVALFNTRDDFSLPTAVKRAIDILSKDSDGFFLMVEGDMHTNRVDAGLRRALELDGIVRSTAERLSADDSLIIYTADHSFDLRLRGGRRGQPLLKPGEEGPDDSSYRGEAIRMENGHTGEEVIVAAQGPGASQVRGFMPNSKIFHIMMDAYGWRPNDR